MRRYFQLLIGTIASVGFIFLFARQLNFTEFKISDFRPSVTWLAVAVCLYSLGVVVRGLRWKMMLRNQLNITLRSSISLVVIGMAANNILPLRSGDIARAALVQQRYDSPFLETVGTIFVEKLLDALTLLFLLALILSFVPQEFAQLYALMAFLGVFGLIGLLLSMANGSINRILLGVLRLFPSRIQSIGAVWSGRLDLGLRSLSSPGRWLQAGVLSVLVWSLEAVSYFDVARSIGINSNPFDYGVVTAAANLAISVPSTAGGVGPFEFFAKESLRYLTDIPSIDIAFYAIFLHLLLLLPVGIVGLLLLWAQGLSIVQVVNKNAKK